MQELDHLLLALSFAKDLEDASGVRKLKSAIRKQAAAVRQNAAQYIRAKMPRDFTFSELDVIHNTLAILEGK